MEPDLATDPHCQPVLEELMRREPVFHRPEFGRTRREFEDMIDPEFREVGASGRRYSREFVLEEVVRRYENPEYSGIQASPENTWTTGDFHCLKIADNNYLISYTLAQGERISRRSTIWRLTGAGWKILYHQGTIVENR